MYWDTDIRAIYEFKNVQELVKLKPMGGGGTDANCIFRYFEENKDYKIGKKKKPTIIIVFTDGYFGQIDKAYKKYKDTIWVVNGDKDFTPPFGSTARFKNED
jgi:predicted metal-dependent peptidase